jgi:hypothetical protein
VTYLVRVVSYLGSGASPDATLVVDNPPCQTGARIRVTFETLQLDSIDDRGDFCILCGTDTQLEVFGSFLVNNKSAYLINGTDPNNCIVPMSAGTYNLQERYMSLGLTLNYATRCNDNGHFQRQSYGYRANEIQTVLTNPSQSFAIHIFLFDDDPAISFYPTEDCVICYNAEFPTRDLVSWQRMDQTYTVHGTVHSLPGDGDQGINQGNATLIYRVRGEPYNGR